MITAIAILVACCSLLGWGRLAFRLARAPAAPWPVAVAVGVGVLVFVGGILNLCRCAFGWTFDAFLGVGLGLVVIPLFFRRPQTKSARASEADEEIDFTGWLHHAVLWLMIAIIVGFTIFTQCPPRVFNVHDDFEFFGHPVRMLQTGTLVGGPLTRLGAETLGGQAVLHAVIHNHFPIEYINAADAVFGLLLCMVLVKSMVPRGWVYVPASAVAVLAVYAINPQYVNVSALYLTSALVMAVFALSAHTPDNTTDEAVSGIVLPSPILVGLLYAAMVALKTLSAVFPVLHAGVLVAALAVGGVGVNRSLLWLCKTTLWGVLFLSPWIALHLPHYLKYAAAAPDPNPSVIVKEPYGFFSPMVYGNSYQHYTILAVAMISCAVGLLLYRRSAAQPRDRMAIAGLIAAAVSVVLMYVILVPWLGPTLIGYSSNLRYTIPFLIAGAAAILALSLAQWHPPGASARSMIASPPLLLGLVVVGCFLPQLVGRMRQAIERGSTLAFLWKQDESEFAELLGYNEAVLHGDIKARIRRAQAAVPAGSPVIAWVTAAHHLDYRRNPIFDAEPAGIANPWARIPAGEYIIIEYDGPVVRTPEDYEAQRREDGARTRLIARRATAFRDGLNALIHDPQILVYRDSLGIAVFRRNASGEVGF